MDEYVRVQALDPAKLPIIEAQSGSWWKRRA